MGKAQKCGGLKLVTVLTFSAVVYEKRVHWLCGSNQILLALKYET
jgi:hypothetical protein